MARRSGRPSARRCNREPWTAAPASIEDDVRQQAAGRVQDRANSRRRSARSKRRRPGDGRARRPSRRDRRRYSSSEPAAVTATDDRFVAQLDLTLQPGSIAPTRGHGREKRHDKTARPHRRPDGGAAAALGSDNGELILAQQRIGGPRLLRNPLARSTQLSQRPHGRPSAPGS